MCGIVGWIGENYNNEIINKIQKSLIHRGPDGFGKWTDYNKKICLLHRRLSILDTSKNGKQPMVSENNRYIISYNGEVYNHLQLRKKIFNYNWKSYSDTETLLASFQKWGIHKTLKNIVGMFSIVILDRKFDQIFLIRDRIGEKPLYYGWQGSCLFFRQN